MRFLTIPLLALLVLACGPSSPTPTSQPPMSERQKATRAAQQQEWDLVQSAQERVARIEELVEDCRQASEVPYHLALTTLVSRITHDLLRPETPESLAAVLSDIDRADDAIEQMEQRCLN